MFVLLGLHSGEQRSTAYELTARDTVKRDLRRPAQRRGKLLRARGQIIRPQLEDDVTLTSGARMKS